MNIPCPYCKAVLSPKGLKPGEFHPRCPGCANKFLLVVPESRTRTVVVRKVTPPGHGGPPRGQPRSQTGPQAPTHRRGTRGTHPRRRRPRELRRLARRGARTGVE